MSFDALHLIFLALAVLALCAVLWLTAKRSALSLRAQMLESEIRGVQNQLAAFAALQREFAELKGKTSATEQAQRDEISQLRQQSALFDALRQRHSALEAESLEKEKSFLEQLRVLKEAEASLKQNFENLANRIFDEKSNAFKSQSKAHFDALLDPLKTQIGEFKNTVEQTNQGIHTLGVLNARMADEATNLTRALKGDNKAQGGWGEQVLGRILEASGLTEGRDYQSQFAYVDEQNSRKQPDCVIFLPDNKAIVVDSKVSLVAYDRYVNAESVQEKEQALKEHLRSVKTHVEGLSSKKYEALPNLRTTDFVVLFIPIESAFIDAMRADDGLMVYALERNVTLATPSTLITVCRTVAHLQKLDQRNTNAMKIADQAGKLYDQFSAFCNDMNKVGKALEQAGEAHQSAFKRLSTGNANLVRQTEQIKALGARVGTKSVPDNFLIDNAEPGQGDHSSP
jgi:DNA recombination protein RmuC